MKISDYFLEANAKPNMLPFQYRNINNKIMLCSLDIVREQEHAYILLTRPAYGRGSVDNDIETITTLIYTQLCLENYLASPNQINWFYLSLNKSSSLKTKLRLMKINIKWDNSQYIEPSWHDINFAEAPFNLEDFINARAALNKVEEIECVY